MEYRRKSVNQEWTAMVPAELLDTEARGLVRIFTLICCKYIYQGFRRAFRCVINIYLSVHSCVWELHCVCKVMFNSTRELFLQISLCSGLGVILGTLREMNYYKAGGCYQAFLRHFTGPLQKFCSQLILIKSRKTHNSDMKVSQQWQSRDIFAWNCTAQVRAEYKKTKGKMTDLKVSTFGFFFA